MEIKIIIIIQMGRIAIVKLTFDGVLTTQLEGALGGSLRLEQQVVEEEELTPAIALFVKPRDSTMVNRGHHHFVVANHGVHDSDHRSIHGINGPQKHVMALTSWSCSA